MIRLLMIFIVLLVSVVLGIQLSRDPGYLLIHFNRWTIETALWVALASLFILFLLFHLLLVGMHRLGKTPSLWRSWRANRRAIKAQAKTRQGLIEFSEGHWELAKNHLIKALPNTDSPLLNYLTAARAAQELGDSKLRDKYLGEAQQCMPDAKIAVELTQAQLQLANQQWEQALATLKHLQDLAPRHPYVLKLLMHLYQEVKDWPQLLALLPELKKYRVISEEEFTKTTLQTYQHAMTDLANYSQGADLTKMVETLPKSLAHEPSLIAIYAQFLLAEGDSERAETILKHTLRKQYNETLINLYGKIKGGSKQLAFAESLLKKHPRSAELLLCLGRLSKHCHLWGKAKNYLESSIAVKPVPEAYAELGELYERLNEQPEACSHYKKGLQLTFHNSINK